MRLDFAVRCDRQVLSRLEVAKVHAPEGTELG